MMKTIKLSELSENTLVGRDIGRETRAKIIKLYREHKDLTIDLEGKTGFSISFVDESFVKLAELIGKEKYLKHIKLINMSGSIKAMINAVWSLKANKA